MRLFFSTAFKKRRKKLPTSVRDVLDGRMYLFERNPFHSLLDNHPLHGKYAGYRSINITGDFRAIYEPIEPDVVYFVRVGTHSELYK